MTLPMRSSPKPVTRERVAVDDDDNQMLVDDEVVSDEASLLLGGTKQSLSSGHSRPPMSSHKSHRRRIACTHVLDALRPTHQSTLNIDLMTLNICFHGFYSIIEIIEHPGPQRTELLSCRYSEIVSAAKLGFERQRWWSQFSCLCVLYAIDILIYGEDASDAAFDSCCKQWDPDEPTLADSLEVDLLDLNAVLPTREDANSFLTSEDVCVQDVDDNAMFESPHLAILDFMTLSLLLLLIRTGVCRDPLYIDCFDKCDAKWVRNKGFITGLSPLARKHPLLLDKYRI